MTSPILFVIFNRPEQTRKVFEEIRKAQPPKLYIAADGPRSNHPGEKEKCEEARAIAKLVDWPCELHTDFLGQNIGCDERVSSAISWFFAGVEEGIIFEDDCLPSGEFFTFTSSLLEKYRHEEKIKMISGNNFQNGRKRGEGSYYFSRYANTWGWATWRRAWNAYDHNLAGFPAFRESKQIEDILPTSEERRYWLNFFEKILKKKYTFWDAKWMFSIWKENGISITPNTNLVSNIGFGSDATHTQGDAEKFSVKIGEMGEIIHPASMEIDNEADRYLFETMYRTPLLEKIKIKLKILWKKMR